MPAGPTQGNFYKAAIDFTRRIGETVRLRSNRHDRLNPLGTVILTRDYRGRAALIQSLLARKVLIRSARRENEVDSLPIPDPIDATG